MPTEDSTLFKDTDRQTATRKPNGQTHSKCYLYVNGLKEGFPEDVNVNRATGEGISVREPG